MLPRIIKDRALNMTKHYSHSRLFIIILLFGVVLWACDENTLDPLDTDTGIYSIYGVLDLNEETNYIRVRDLNSPFTDEATRELNAEVTLENLSSGTVEVLESVRTENEDVYHHNFVVNGVIQPDTEYRITVKRTDGVTVAVASTTPTKPEPVITSANTDCYTPIEVEFAPVNGGTIVYIIVFQFRIPRSSPPRVLRSDGNNSGKLSFTFTPVDVIRSNLLSNLSHTLCHDLDSKNFIILYRHYGPGLYEKIENDPFDILRSTERFGGYYFERLEIPIDTSRVCPPDC